jgi:hypothetical protein
VTWARLDDAFPDHAKIEGLTDAAFRLHIAGICHAARYLTDGFVPENRVGRLTPSFKRTSLTELVDTGLWHEAVGGWMIHDFLDYNPSAEKIRAERKAAAERMARSRERAAEQTPNVRSNNRRTNGVSSAAPTRPDPFRGRGSVSELAVTDSPPPASTLTGAGGSQGEPGPDADGGQPPSTIPSVEQTKAELEVIEAQNAQSRAERDAGFRPPPLAKKLRSGQLSKEPNV